MAIRVRRGNEADFDANKMLPGEWAVSLDTKYVRMCFAPGVCLRMATYEGFESDMERVEAILTEVESIEAAIKAIQKDVNANVDITIEQKELAAEYAEQSKEYARQAKESADRASEVSDIQYATSDRAGIVAPQDIYVDPSNGHMKLIASANTSELKNSFDGGLRFKEMVAVENEQTTTTGAQLFVYNNTSKTASGVTFTLNNDQTFDITGTSTAGDGVFAKGYNYTGTNVVLSLKAGTYCVSGMPQNIRLVLYKANTSSSEYVLVNKNGTFTIDTDTDFTSISIRWASANIQFNEKNVKIMINSGTEALAWEPYTGGIPAPNPNYPQDIKSVDVREIKTSGKNFVPSEWEQGMLNVDNGKTVISNAYWLHTPKYVKVDSSLRYMLSSDSTNSSIVFFYDENMNFLSNKQALRDSKTASVSLPSNCKYIRFGYNLSGSTEATTPSMMGTVHYLQFEVGDKVTEYEPYHESVVTPTGFKLNGIGDVKDRLIRKDGVWQIERKFAEVVFDGSDDEGWLAGNSTNTSNKYRGQTKFLVGKIKNGDISKISNILCDRYIATTSNTSGTYGCNQGISVNNDGGIFVYDENVNTGDASLWKAHLQSKPIALLFELATPTYEVLPLADQVALNSLLTFDGITYLSIESELEPTYLYEYGTSKVGGYTLKSLNTSEANEVRIKAMESITNNLASAILEREE